MYERPTTEQQSIRDTTDERDTVSEAPDDIRSQQQPVRGTTGDMETRDVESSRASDIRDERSTRDERATEGFLPDEQMSSFRDRWSDIQAGFVDDPRDAVQRAQQLVDDLVKQLTDVFSRERSTLEGQWSSGSQADTETLRVALQRYRDFFNRLLGT